MFHELLEPPLIYRGGKSEGSVYLVLKFGEEQVVVIVLQMHRGISCGCLSINLPSKAYCVANTLYVEV